MAVAGGAKSAYKMHLQNGTLRIEHTTAIDAPAPLPAMAATLRGETVTVGGFDSAVVQTLVSQAIEIDHLSRLVSEVTASRAANIL